MNDVIVKIITGLDIDEDSETASMKTSRSEHKNYIEFHESNKTMYVTFQSEMQKDHKKEVV
jgi:hypothetical protein